MSDVNLNYFHMIESAAYCDCSIARPSVSAETEPDRFPCRTSVSDNFNRISASVGTDKNEQCIAQEDQSITHISSMPLHKSLDDRHVVPWQRVLAQSIPALTLHPNTRLTVRRPAWSRKHHP